MSDSIYQTLSLYTQPILIVLGTIGAVINLILFFSRRTLRTTSCSLYFRALSINDLFVIYFYILPQWLADQYQIDPSIQSNSFCKLKTFLNNGLYTVSPYLVVLACFDRLCTSSTNARLRRVASIHVALILTIVTVFIVFAAYSHTLVFYQLISTPYIAYCISLDADYNRVYASFLITFLGIAPPILMGLFCSITFLLLRQQRRRVMPVNQARLRQRDNQLLKMLFIYVITHSICTIPFSVIFILLMYQSTNAPPILVVLFRCFILLFNVNFCTSFYIYTLGTPFYREELSSLTMSLKTFCCTLTKFNPNRRHTRPPVATS